MSTDPPAPRPDQAPPREVWWERWGGFTYRDATNVDSWSYVGTNGETGGLIPPSPDAVPLVDLSSLAADLGVPGGGLAEVRAAVEGLRAERDRARTEGEVLREALDRAPARVEIWGPAATDVRVLRHDGTQVHPAEPVRHPGGQGGDKAEE